MSGRNIPLVVRQKWLKKLRHRKVRYIFTGYCQHDVVLKAFNGLKKPSTSHAADDEDESAVCHSHERLHPVDNDGEALKPSDVIAMAKQAGELADGDSDEEDDEDINTHSEDVDHEDGANQASDDDNDSDDPEKVSIHVYVLTHRNS